MKGLYYIKNKVDISYRNEDLRIRQCKSRKKTLKHKAMLKMLSLIIQGLNIPRT